MRSTMAAIDINFIGASKPLTQDGFHAAIESIDTKAAELWALISVETSGCGYLTTVGRRFFTSGTSSTR